MRLATINKNEQKSKSAVTDFQFLILQFESQDVLVPWPKAYCLNSGSGSGYPGSKLSAGAIPCINELDPDRYAQKSPLTSKRYKIFILIFALIVALHSFLFTYQIHQNRVTKVQKEELLDRSDLQSIAVYQ